MRSGQRPPIPGAVFDFLKAYERYLIVSHVDPDGDCICSSLALGHFLERRGHSVRYFNQGPFDRPEIKPFEHHFRREIDHIATEGASSVAAIVVDCSTPDRVGKLAGALETLPVAVLDHHASGTAFGDLRYVDPHSPSTSFIVQRVIEGFGDSPDGEESHQLFFALATDTGFFRHLEAGSSDVLEAAARLVAAGVSPSRVYYEISGGRTLGSRKLLGRLLSRVESHFDGRLLYSWMTPTDANELGSKTKDSDTLYQVLLSTENCEAVAFLREDGDGNTNGSLRSTDAVNVGRIAQEFGGGGHPKAAGFSVRRPAQDVRDELLTQFSAVFER